MIRELPPQVRQAGAGLVIGVGAAGIVRCGGAWFGHSPRIVALALGAGLAGMAVAALGAGGGRGGRVIAGVGGAAAVLGGATGLGAVWSVLGTDGLGVGASVLAALAGWAASRPVVGDARGRIARVAALAAWLVALRWGRPELLVGGAALVGAALAAVGVGGASGSTVVRGPWARAVGGAAGAGLVVAAGMTAWAVLRVGVDPTPAGAWALLGAGAAGAALSRGRAIPLAAAVALLATAGALLSPGMIGSALDRVGAHGLYALAGIGGIAGLAVGRLPVGATAVGLVLGPLVADAALLRLATEDTLVAVAPRATLLGDPVRADSLARLHAEWTPTRVQLSTLGAGALWTRGDAMLLEMDGVVADPSTRAAQAERFAGVLASCLTAGRSSARVAGDDLGLVLLSLRAQGFATVDAAVPQRELARGLADVVPVLGQAWLSPGVRLLPVPAPVVLRFGAPADAVVEVVRAPWTDAGRALPDLASLEATRRTVRPGGVHLLALATTTVPPAVVSHLLREFLAVYPTATLWLPPAGADTALLAGRVDDGPVPWAGMEGCASGAGARSLGLSTADDIAGLVLAAPALLRALPEGVEPWFGLPPDSPVAGPPPLAVMDWRAAPGTPVFDASGPDVDARRQTLLSFLDLLRSASSGEMDRAVATARSLAGAPGGALALRPLVRPQLDRVRAAMARGEHEGLASKAWDEAETALTSARVLAPDFPETRCVEGELAVRRGQVPRAEEAFQACLRGEPGSLAALDGLATVRRLQEDRIGLEKTLREAREAHPEAWTTAHNLGFFLYTLGRHEEAERWLVEGASLNARGATPSPAPSLALGHLYLDTRRPALALAQGVRAGQLQPSAEASFIRGAARYDLGQYDAAEAEFRDALRLDPESTSARGGLGLVLAQRGEYAAAAEAFKAVLARDPRNLSATENLRRVQALVGGAAP